MTKVKDGFYHGGIPGGFNNSYILTGDGGYIEPSNENSKQLLSYTKGTGFSWTASVNNTDEYVKYNNRTTNNKYPLIFSNVAPDSLSDDTTHYVSYNLGAYLNPSSYEIALYTTATNKYPLISVQSGNTEKLGLYAGTSFIGLRHFNPDQWLISYNHISGNTLLECGNVGIGTSSPTEKLHVSGNLKVTQSSYTKQLFITSTSKEGHINFARTTYNYLYNANDSANIGIIINSTNPTREAALCQLLVNKSSVYPGKTNSYTLGNIGAYWKGTYSEGFYKNDSSNDYVLLGGGGHTTLDSLSSSHNHDDRYWWTNGLGTYIQTSTGTDSTTYSDLNSYTTPGTYYSANSNVTRRLKNVPISGAGFKLYVERNYANTYLNQYIIPNPSSSFIYTRGAYYASNTYTWGDWKIIPKLPLPEDGTRKVLTYSSGSISWDNDSNTDTKVIQTDTTYNYSMPILVRKTANGISGSADTTYYNTNVTINPNSSTINAYYLNLTYNSANGAGAVLTFGRSGSVNYIQSPDENSPFYIRTGNSNYKVSLQIAYTGIYPGWKNAKNLGSSTYAWAAAYSDGFYKTSSSNNYVLLGGGGHKAVSDFATSGHTHQYITSAGFTSNGSTSLGTWGTTTVANGYTGALQLGTTGNGCLEISYKSGQIFQQIDGFYYQNEGQYRVTDVSETVTYVKSATIAEINNTNEYPKFYSYTAGSSDLALVSGYYANWYVLNMGKYTATSGNYASQIAMPYNTNLTDSEMFIRTAKNTTWRDWRKVLHSGNSYVTSGVGTINNTKITQVDNATNATNVTVTNNYTSDADYPIVWSNVGNANSSSANQLYKSFTYLSWNAKNHFLTVNGAKETLKLNSASNYNVIYYTLTNSYAWSVGSNTSNQFYFWNNSGQSTVTYITYAGNLYAKGGFIKNNSSDNYVLLGGGGHALLSDLSSSHNHNTEYLPSNYIYAKTVFTAPNWYRVLQIRSYAVGSSILFSVGEVFNSGGSSGSSVIINISHNAAATITQISDLADIKHITKIRLVRKGTASADGYIYVDVWYNQTTASGNGEYFRWADLSRTDIPDGYIVAITPTVITDDNIDGTVVAEHTFRLDNDVVTQWNTGTGSGWTSERRLLFGEITDSTTSGDKLKGYTYNCSKFYVKPSTGTIYATTFSGNLSGNVTGNVTGNATTVSTIANNTSATFYPTFVDSNNASATAETIYTNKDLYISKANASYAMVLRHPATSVDGNSCSSRLIVSNSYNQIEMMTANEGGLYHRTKNNWIIAYSYANGSTFLSLGNVGIGTSSPTYKLQVNGTGYFGNILDIDRTAIGANTGGTKLNVLRTRMQNAGGTNYTFKPIINIISEGETGSTVDQLVVEFGSQSGNTFITAGEGASRYPSIGYLNHKGAEDIIMVADQQIKFIVKAQSLTTSATTSYTLAASFNSNGHFIPGSNQTFNIGSSALAWNNIYAYAIHIMDDGAHKHIEFSRSDNPNYIVAPSGGSIALNTTGNAALASTTLLVDSTSVYNGKTNTFDLGKTSDYWRSAYITTLYTGNTALQMMMGRSGWNYISIPNDSSTFAISYGTDSSALKALIAIDKTSMYPNFNNSLDLGKSANYYKAAYITNIYGTSFSGNAATATKLSTTRKIWGQEFDGTADVRNTLYVIDSAGNNTTASAKIKFNNLVDTDASAQNSPYIQGVVDGITSTYGRKRLGFFVSNDAKYNGDYTEALSILPTANIGIGITNPLEKLDVNGNSYIRGALYLDTQYHKTSYGIHFYNRAYNTWIEYMSNKANGPGGAAHPTGNIVTSWAMRSIIENAAGYGWIWESSSNTANSAISNMMELSSNTGNLWVKGSATAHYFRGALYCGDYSYAYQCIDSGTQLSPGMYVYRYNLVKDTEISEFPNGQGANDGLITTWSWGSDNKYGAQLYVGENPGDMLSFRQRSSTGVWNRWEAITGKYYLYKKLVGVGWYRVLDCATYGTSILVSIAESYNNSNPAPCTFIISMGYQNAKITQIDRACKVPTGITKIRVVRYANGKHYVDVYFAVGAAAGNGEHINFCNLGHSNSITGLTPIDWDPVEEAMASGQTLDAEENLSMYGDSHKDWATFTASDTTANKMILITIKSSLWWMLKFNLHIYNNYISRDISISGYRYYNTSTPWYSPKAEMYGTSGNSLDITFGYITDRSGLRWIAFPKGNHQGVCISEYTAGYDQDPKITPKELFDIQEVDSSYITTSPMIVQTTITAQNKADIATKLGTSSIGNSVQPIYLSSGVPTVTQLYSIVYNSTTAADDYYKIADINLTGSVYRWIKLHVSCGRQSTISGILYVQCNSSSNQYAASAIKFHALSSGLPLDNFKLLYFNGSDSVTFEVWAKLTGRYNALAFKFIDGGAWGTNGYNYFNLYSSTSAGATALPTTTTIGSTTVNLTGTLNCTLDALASSATSATNLAGGAKNSIPYQTAAGTTGFITAPSAAARKVLTYSSGAISWTDDVNTWRPINVNSGTALNDTSTTVNFVNGTGISITRSNGNITIASTVTDTDTKVTQTVTTTAGNYPILFKNTTATSTITDTSRFASGITINPSTKTLAVTYLNGIAYNIAGGGTCTIAYQSAPGMTKFVSSPSANTYLKFDGSKFVWDTVTDTNTDTKVSFTNTTTSSNYPILFKYSTSDTTTAASARFNTGFYYKPSTYTTYSTYFQGWLSGTANYVMLNGSIASTTYYLLGAQSAGPTVKIAVGYPYFVGNDLYQGSDKNLKKDIKEISDEFTYSLFLSYYNIIKDFTWKKTNKPSTGFIAQELSYIIPDAVNYDHKSYTYSVNYNQALSKMVGALLKKVKEQDERISYLEYIMSYIK